MLKEKLSSFLRIPIFIVMFIAVFFISMMGSSRIYCNDAEMQKQKLVPVYRLWNEKPKDHMVTTSSEEKDMLQNSLKYNYEGIEGYIYETQQPDTVPLYRYYDEKIGDHYCTSNEGFKKLALNLGYHYEGILGYIYKIQQPNTVPFYQFYSEVRQDHFITSDADFFKFARQFGGYNNEGIEGYILKIPKVKEKLK